MPYRALPLGGSPKGLCAVLDLLDWWEAQHWRWGVRISWKNDKPKFYAGRSTRVGGIYQTIWLHKWVLGRARGPAPTPDHHIGDHRDGNSLNCRRLNLRWATDQMNSRNRFGFDAQQLGLALSGE